MAEDPKNARELMRRTAVAVLAGAVSVRDPALGPAALAMIPIGEVVAARIGQSRTDHAEEALGFAVEASGESPQDFVEHATANDRRIELLTRTLVIAQDAALREKRRALGRALAAGVAGDDARVDDELMFIRAVADVDTPHIRLLARMSAPGRPPVGWTVGKIQVEDPGLGDAWYPVLSVIRQHGLVQELRSSIPWQASQTSYAITSLGRNLLQRLESDAAAGTENPT